MDIIFGIMKVLRGVFSEILENNFQYLYVISRCLVFDNPVP